MLPGKETAVLDTAYSIRTAVLADAPMIGIHPSPSSTMRASMQSLSDPPAPRRETPSAKPEPFRDFGPSKAQLAADAKWPAEDPDATLRRFVDEQIPRLKKYCDYREMLEKQKDIDGGLIGGAALQAELFQLIVDAVKMRGQKSAQR